MIRACPSCGKKNRIPAKHLADTGKCGHCQATLPPVDAPLDVGLTDFDEIITGAKVPVLVDFWADWCGPCKMAAPHVKRTASDKAGKAIVLKVDTDANQALAQRYGVKGIPNFMVFRGGKPVFQHAGVVDAREMLRWLDGAS